MRRRIAVASLIALSAFTAARAQEPAPVCREPATDDRVARYIHTLSFAPRITAPVLMVNATGDGRPLGEELFTAMPEPKRQIWYETDRYQPARAYSAGILAWLRQRLD